MMYINEIDLAKLTVCIEGAPGSILSFFTGAHPELYYPLQRMHGITSQVGLHQACGLILLARQLAGKEAAILNIGCAFGYSTACLAEGAPDADIVSLDVLPKRIKIAKRNLAKYPNVKVLQQASWDFFLPNAGRLWDMIFVDGCHRAIWKDMPFYNTVRPGGLFVSHDYIPERFPFVVEALDSLTKQFARPYDVRIYDDRECGVVGMVRREDEWWKMPKDYQWTEEAVRGFKDGQ